MPTYPASVSTDRLGFTLFLALAVHALIIFGIGFASQPSDSSTNTLAVTLSYHPSDQAPDKPDFKAPDNQLGSGSLDKKREITSDQLSPFKGNTAADVNLTAPSARRPTQSSRLVITSISAQEETAADKEGRQQVKPQPLPEDTHDNLQPLSQRIATLEARLSNQKQTYAKRPRINFIASASTVASYEAAYINQFRDKVETIGTRNFPATALKQKIFGEVRLRVDILPTGHVKQIKLLHSSGHSLLDHAAMQSVRRAAPFAPFTLKMRQHFDVLAVIRTWKFDASSRVSSSYSG